MKRTALLAVTAAFLLSAAPANAVPDFSSTARNIIPSGQYGAVPVPPKADRQARMYDALTPLFDDVTRRDLFRYFKSEKLGVKGQGRMRRERVPRRGVRILRDKHNVPHIRGRTNDDVTWGAGWALARDRELLLEQARYVAPPVGLGEQQHAVRADSGVRRAQPPDPFGAQLEGEGPLLHDDVVVPQRLPLLESHRRKAIGRAAPRAAPPRRRRPRHSCRWCRRSARPRASASR